jgi:hypothetical protein
MGMVYRITMQPAAPDLVIFEGRLSLEAVEDLRTHLRTRPSAKVLLRAGTEVGQDALAALMTVGVPVTAESPFVSRWLAALRPPMSPTPSSTSRDTKDEWES